MRLYHLLTSGLFIAMILLMSISAAVRALPYKIAQGTDVIQGELTRSFESHYDKVFPVKTFGTNLWAALQFTLFGEGRSGVVIGRNGWLYTSEEFRSDEQADAQIQAHLDLITRVQQSLQQRGIALVVALLPAKARMYPEHLADEQPGELHRALYARIRGDLAARGVSAPDLLAAMAQCKTRGPVFLRTDTHWTPAGARCTAGALALAAPSMATANAQTFVTQTEATRTHQGDLMQFLPLAPYFSALLPQPDALVPSSTQALGGDLLSDTPAPSVVLIGTSYSADERWNFDGALRQAMAEDVLNLAEPGKGPFQPMLAYLDRAPDGTRPTRVIWEIPERYLPAGELKVPPDNGLHLAQATSASQTQMNSTQEKMP